MKAVSALKKDLYYTRDHEWINFQGSIAYIGVCNFKLKGIKQVEKIVFADDMGFKKQGEPIAVIHHDDYRIQVAMPVDGRIINLNQELINGQQHSLPEDAEGSGWLAMIAPSQPYERRNLLQHVQYNQLLKRKP
jgi:glycine cleavage system H protein